MSLIDEALKRVQAAHQDAASSQAARPWAPTPLPDLRRARRRRRTRLLSGALLLGLLVAAALFFFGRSPGKSRGRVAGTSAGATPPGQAAAPLMSPASSSPAILSEVFVPPPPRRPTLSTRGQASSRAAARPAEAVAPAHDASARASSENDAQPPAEVSRAPAFSDGKTYVGEVTLSGGERIELGGIVFSEANPVALINGRVAGTGYVVEGFTVAEIQTDRVKLEGEDGTIWIRLK